MPGDSTALSPTSQCWTSPALPGKLAADLREPPDPGCPCPLCSSFTWLLWSGQPGPHSDLQMLMVTKSHNSQKVGWEPRQLAPEAANPYPLIIAIIYWMPAMFKGCLYIFLSINLFLTATLQGTLYFPHFADKDTYGWPNTFWNQDVNPICLPVCLYQRPLLYLLPGAFCVTLLSMELR